MLNLPTAGGVDVRIESVRIMTLPEPIRVYLSVTDEDGEETALAPIRTGALLPGPSGPSTWAEAILSELTACVGPDPAGLDVRHLPRLLTGAEVRIRTIKTVDGSHVLIGVSR